jgi:hypothetical protein
MIAQLHWLLLELIPGRTKRRTPPRPRARLYPTVCNGTDNARVPVKARTSAVARRRRKDAPRGSATRGFMPVIRAPQLTRPNRVVAALEFALRTLVGPSIRCFPEEHRRVKKGSSVNPERLLRDVPTIEEWAASHVNLASLAPAHIGRVEDAYWTEFAVRLPAFDEDGRPTMLADEHIIDGFARAWLSGIDEVADRRAGFGTVAVVVDRVECDACGWGAARYESRVGSRREFAALCLCCLARRGDPILGPGHSTLMLLPDEVPDRVMRTLLPYIDQEARGAWEKKRHGDSWDSYRRWGFSGPDEDGCLYAVILNLQLSVRPGPIDSVELIAQRTGIRHVYTPGGDTHYGPRNLDDLDARSFLLRILRRETHSGRAREALDRQFAVSAEERDGRAMSALERQGGVRWLRLDQHLICESADYEMAVAAAAHSGSPWVLARLAHSHPDCAIRSAALANPALEPGELAAAAARRDAAVSQALLERADLSAESTIQVVETLLLAGSLEHHTAYAALKRPNFPDHLLDTVITRIAATGTSARVALAESIHEAPPHRRDAVHVQLLRGARKIKSTAELIDAAVGNDEARAEWFANSPEWKIRDLMAWRNGQRGAVAPRQEVDAEPPNDPPADTVAPAVILTAPAVSARLRRWWLREAMADEDFLASDLGDALHDCTLVRLASELQVYMPYDFGLGSPVDQLLEQRLTARVADLSDGTVRRISWSFKGVAKLATRKRSTDLDIYEPGDPLWDNWGATATDLAREIVRQADKRALTALSAIRLAGVSRHRIWLALPNRETVQAIGTTPGAAASLKVAVAKVQGRKPEEALYATLADPSQDTIALPP